MAITDGFKGLMGGRIFFLIAIIVMAFYLVNATEPVPNLRIEADGTQTVLFTPEMKVFPSGVTTFHALIIAGAAVALAFGDAQGRRKITHKEALKIAYDEVEYKKKVLNLDEFNGDIKTKNAWLRTVMTKGTSIPFKWVVGVEVEKESGTEYFQVGIEPEGDVKEFMSRGSEFGLTDVCYKCGGKNYDLNPIVPQELHELRKLISVR